MEESITKVHSSPNCFLKSKYFPRIHARLYSRIRPLEPRHTPTRVAFFTTPAGVGVRSAAGGRTYSAVATVDGRVFKWGLHRTARPPRDGNKHSRDGGGGEDRRNDPSEGDGEAAVEASVPRQAAGVGVKASRSLLCL